MIDVIFYTVPQFNQILKKIFDLPEVFNVTLSRDLMLNDRQTTTVEFSRGKCGGLIKDTVIIQRRVYVFVADGEKWYVRSQVENYLKELNINNLNIDDFCFRERPLIINEIV